ncbi:hypothetical protein BDZ45DRAFT_607609 [Acephala macrosclerotiorum]|nr:hypothetical protein BDZ45DRAFT_607609 [Acephala macrosclerotiorum]
MGQNLSSNYSKTIVDTAQDVITPPYIRNGKILALLWLGSAYAMAMIWSTTLLYDRWVGPQGRRAVGFRGVLAAILLSSAWPAVLLYLVTTRTEIQGMGRGRSEQVELSHLA